MASADGSESAAKSGCKLDDIEKAYDLFSHRRDVALNRKISLRKLRKAKCSEELASGPAPPSRLRMHAGRSVYTVVLLCTQGRETTISMAKGLVQMVFVGMGLAVVSRKSSGGGGRYWSSAYLTFQFAEPSLENW